MRMNTKELSGSRLFTMSITRGVDRNGAEFIGNKHKNIQTLKFMFHTD